MEWGFDTPTGTFRNHDVSEKVRDAAIAQTKFLPFCDVEPGYGKRKGESVMISRIRNVAEPTSATFSERDRVPIDQFSMSTKALTVEYFGRGIEITELAQMLTYFDLKDKIQRKLMQQMKLVMDSAAAVAFKAAPLKFCPTTLSGGSVATSLSTASVNLTVSHLKIIRDAMSDTYHVPGWRGSEDFYGLLSTKACRGIRNDPEFIEAHKYSSPSYLTNGEIGKVENIKIVEVNHTQALANNKGTGGVLGEGVVFGDDAVAMAVVEDPDIRVELPTNFGLQMAVAWVGLLKYDVVWDTSNDGEARIVHIGSS